MKNGKGEIMATWNAWNKQETNYLIDNWGEKSIKKISKAINRTECGVRQKAKKMKLGGIINASEYLVSHQVAEMLGKQTKTIIHWIKCKGLKGKYRFIGKGTKRGNWLIKYDDLMEWLETNQDKYDARKIKQYALGCEPEWLKEKRKRDEIEIQNTRKIWTKMDEERLLDLYHEGYSVPELMQRFGRTEKSIGAKLYRACHKKLNQ